ncbi:MAG TPA: hypothetical protein VGF23_13075 [Gaiellaceae bacterium]
MTAAAALVAFPVTMLVIWGLLRLRVARRLVAAPRADRWHERDTPLLGGVGIFAGLLAGVGTAVAGGVIPASGEVLGIMGGCALLFVAGLADDVVTLKPLTKLAAQVAAAALVLKMGVSVEIVSNDVLAWTIGLVWLVGMTNAFNLLDNMDGLAATLALIGCVFFAIDAVTIHPNDTVLAISLALALACAGFLPFNLRLQRPALVFMGDSGSQVLGFGLATLGLSSSWKVAGSTAATLLLPVLVLAVPILDTVLVSIVRLLEGRPIHQGGRDHTSHRLVYYGLSEKRAVVLLAVLSAALGATSLAYTTLDDTRITLAGVLLTFAVLLQFGSFLSSGQRTAPVEERLPGILRAFVVHRRRLLEVAVDFALIAASFTVAFIIRVQGEGTVWQRHIFNLAIPVVLAARYVTFIPFGLYRGVWRYAGARDALNVVGAVVVSEAIAFGVLSATVIWNGFPRGVFVIDAFICTALIGASRFGERAIDGIVSELRNRSSQRRTLIVGAGRGGRSLLRELRETPGERVIGFVDDDSSLRRRRLQGVPVLGAVDEIGFVLGRTHPDTVLVTIPDAARDRLDAVVEACGRAGIPCRFVRREIDLDPRVVLGATAD